MGGWIVIAGSAVFPFVFFYIGDWINSGEAEKLWDKLPDWVTMPLFYAFWFVVIGMWGVVVS